MSMEKRDGAGASAAAPVVRQLDFTVNFMTAANVNAKGNLLLPDHPLDQSQSKWLATGNSQHAHAIAGPQSPSRTVAQTKLPPRKVVMPPKSPYKELPQMEGQAKSPLLAPRLSQSMGNPVPMPKRALQPLIKLESPKSRERNVEQNDGTPKKQKQCRCKNSRCLKLYCECFANGVYCDGCNCINCFNKKENEAGRKEAIDAVLERKPDAFFGVEQNRGCNCKRTGCLKKYCECFQANVPCSDKCKCIDCKNFEGSEERTSRLFQHSADSMVFIQQANAAINGALGTPSKRSRYHQIGFDVASNRFTSWLPESHQETCFKSDTTDSPSSVRLSKPEPTKLGISKSSYRSPLSGILQSQHVEDFCNLLVEVSTEAAKSHSEERKMFDNGIDVNRAETSGGHNEDDKDRQNQQNGVEFPGNGRNSDRTSMCESDGYDIQDGRPLSPGTLALMCDERDATFMAADAPPSTVTESNTRTSSKLASTLGPNELYVEQETLVLTRLRCFLNRLITCGSIEETRVEQANP